MQEFELPVDPKAAAMARETIAGFDLPEPPQVDATLLLSELVTNAVRHADLDADDTIVWRADQDRRLRIEVCDPGEGFHLRGRDRVEGDPGGWGLYLVDHLADRWGIERQRRHTCVWFEMPLAE